MHAKLAVGETSGMTSHCCHTDNRRSCLSVGGGGGGQDEAGLEPATAGFDSDGGGNGKQGADFGTPPL